MAAGERGLRHKNLAEGEFLAFLSVKHNVNPDKLFQALISAKEQQRIMCGSLPSNAGVLAIGKNFLDDG